MISEAKTNEITTDEHRIFMEALKKVNPTLANIAEYATRSKDQIMTFEDCARVEKEINDALSGITFREA